METNNFMMNDIFRNSAKVYQTKPVRATRYQPGMETGWVVYMQNEPNGDLDNNLHEGMKFFDTEQEARDYINADHKQYINKNGVLTEIAVVYETPMPVLHRKETDPEKKVGSTDCFQGKYTLLSNETEMYDFFRMKTELLVYGVGIAKSAAMSYSSVKIMSTSVKKSQMIPILMQQSNF